MPEDVQMLTCACCGSAATFQELMDQVEQDSTLLTQDQRFMLARAALGQTAEMRLDPYGYVSIHTGYRPPPVVPVEVVPATTGKLLWHQQCRILILDFETTGFSPALDRVIQIGATLLEYGVVTWRRSQLVQPGRAVDPRSTVVHGITDAMLTNAPTFGAAGQKVFDGLETEGLLIAGHNGEFDRRFLLAESTRHDITAAWLQQPWYDTYALAKLLDGKRKMDKGYKLTDLRDRFDIKVEGESARRRDRHAHDGAAVGEVGGTASG